jgi:lipopolysaccharide transport system ATP-binding protein
MYMRLAFAVAAHLEPEILIVDEVLAVGDAEFQKKCIGKMGEVRQGGRTVLFVSHNMGMIQALCDWAVVLHQGRVKKMGNTREVVTSYLSSASHERVFERKGASENLISVRSAFAEVKETGARTILEISTVLQSSIEATISLDIRLLDGCGMQVGFGAVGSFNHAQVIRLGPETVRIVSAHDISTFATGPYSISLDVANPTVGYYDRVEHCLAFEVQSPPRQGCYRRLDQRWGLGSVELPYVGHHVEAHCALPN